MTAKPAKATVAEVPIDLQGRSIDAFNSEALRSAIEWAFNYRGDVTITLTSNLAIEGYVFDRRWDGEAFLRLMPRNSDERMRIPIAEIASISFTGKDTASGKTFENWIRKYALKKLAGESANLESESLDEE
jgi:hypothetical protein